MADTSLGSIVVDGAGMTHPLVVWATRRRPAAAGTARTRLVLARVSGAITVVTAIASLVLVGLTGYAGATAVWGA